MAGLRSGGVLNAKIVGAAAAVEGASQASTALQKQMLRLLDDHLDEDGNKVDYRALRYSPAFAAFCDSAGELGELPVEALDASAPLEERKAFWINLYNCLVLHATAVLGAPANAAARSAFFSGASGAAYRVAGMRFCLDDIEHGILRCNAPTVGSEREEYFEPGDDRLGLALSELDPRIHFALNCGAKSCPPIKFYTAGRLEENLALSARAFLESDLQPDEAASTLTCSRLLEWYGRDFGPDAKSRIGRLRTMLPAGSPLHDALGKFTLPSAACPKITYREYDWGTNDSSMQEVESEEA